MEMWATTLRVALASLKQSPCGVVWGHLAHAPRLWDKQLLQGDTLEGLALDTVRFHLQMHSAVPGQMARESRCGQGQEIRTC